MYLNGVLLSGLIKTLTKFTDLVAYDPIYAQVESCGNTQMLVSFPTVFLVLPNFHSCFYN